MDWSREGRKEKRRCGRIRVELIKSNLGEIMDMSGQGLRIRRKSMFKPRIGRTTVVMKTLAVLPGRSYAGLGSHLVRRNQTMASELGYQRVVHALMHTGNPSRGISRRYGNTIRRYTLFARMLR